MNLNQNLKGEQAAGCEAARTRRDKTNSTNTLCLLTATTHVGQTSGTSSQLSFISFSAALPLFSHTCSIMADLGRFHQEGKEAQEKRGPTEKDSFGSKQKVVCLML